MRWVHWLPEEFVLPKAAILVEGLPGIGHVGQVLAHHLVERTDAHLVTTLHSPDFPPQAIVDPDGMARLVALRLHHAPSKGDAPDMLVLSGDTQAISPHGQFEVTRQVLERLREDGLTHVITLGGVPGAKEEPRTIGAATTKEMVARIEKAGAVFDELGPDGGIIGASGVFLGLAGRMGIPAACLMGESDGSLVDTRAAQAVLPVLSALIGRKIDHAGLESVARAVEEHLQMLDEVRYYAAPTDAEHHYIG